MLRGTLIRRCSSATSSVQSGSCHLEDFGKRVEKLCHRMRSKHAAIDGVGVRPREKTCRGLFADRVFSEGATVLSIPLRALSISSTSLLEQSEYVRSVQPPTLDDVCRLMTARSIQDRVLYDQIYLALLLAAEHMNPDSFLNSYFELLPHPAMDDAEVIALHKDVLDPMVLVEWDDYQKEFLAILHILLRRWGPRAPPIEVAYWAWRTVLSRMHMMPVRGLAPTEVGSSLSYAALSTVGRAEQQTRWTKRIRATVGSLFGGPNVKEDYYLVPTLVPLLDFVGHLPSSNVRVEVASHPNIGSCVELQAIRQIERGEELGMRYNASQSPAFLMYRFGFIPQ